MLYAAGLFQFLFSLVLYKVLSVRVEDVQQNSRLQAHAAVDHVVHLKKGVPFLYDALENSPLTT